jgi:hypothetical protein
MKIRRVVLAPIAATFLAGYFMVGCSPAQCTYTNAITHQRFTAPCNNNPGGGGGGGGGDNNDNGDDHGDIR